MPKTLKTPSDILLELKIILLQLALAKRGAKKLHTPRNAIDEVESRLSHSLHSLNHLIVFMDDFKTSAEINASAKHSTKET